MKKYICLVGGVAVLIALFALTFVQDGVPFTEAFALGEFAYFVLFAAIICGAIYGVSKLMDYGKQKMEKDIDQLLEYGEQPLEQGQDFDDCR